MRTVLPGPVRLRPVAGSRVPTGMHSSPQTNVPRLRRSTPILLGVAAAVVSAMGSWIPSKWDDEAATQAAASRSLAQLWQLVQHVDAVHGAFYALMHFWTLGFGTSNLAERAPSAIAVGIAASGVVVLGTRLSDRRTGMIAAVVFLVLPRVTWAGAEARSYALTAALAVWLTILLLRSARSRGRMLWLAYGLAAGLSVTINIYLALLVLAHGITLMAVPRAPSRRRTYLSWGLATALAALLALPIIHLSIAERGQLHYGPLDLLQTANGVLIPQYFAGATPSYDRGVPMPPTSLWAWCVVLLAAVGWILVARAVVWGGRRRSTASSGRAQLLGVAIPWIVLPVLAVVGISAVIAPMYTARYFTFTTPAVALLMGYGIAALSRRWIRVAALVVIVALAVPVYLSQRDPTSKNGTDWQSVTAIITAHDRAGQDIYYGPVGQNPAVAMSRIADAYPTSLSNLHDITLDQSGVSSGTLWGIHRPLTAVRGALRKTPLLWVVLSHWGTRSPATTPQQRYLEAQGLHLQRIWRGTATDVLLFTRTG